MNNCIFCKIIAGELPADFIYQDDKYVVFHDIKPKAKTHLLIVPKLHVVSLLNTDKNDPTHNEMLIDMIHLLPKIAKDRKLPGFRTVINSGTSAGQEVDHIHFHLLAGDIHGF